MDRAGKAEAIETLRGVFDTAGAVVVAHYIGSTVKELEDLRARLRAEGAKLQIVKNTLAQKAMDGRAGEGGDALFTGPVAIAYAPDPVSAAKVTTDYAKGNDKFVVVGAVMGSTVLDAKGVGALATLPSLDQLRAQILGLVAAPATRLATIISAPGAGLARVVNAYATKDGDTPAEAA
jgi:large subunit ribosomal protein L10